MIARTETLPAALRLLRESRGLTQRKVARSLGLHPSMIGAWERGLRMPTLDRFVDLAEYYDVDLGELEDAMELAGASPRRRRQTDTEAKPRRLARLLLGERADLSEENELTQLLSSVFALARRLRQRHHAPARR